jgi:site-specific DNA recombinase
MKNAALYVRVSTDKQAEKYGPAYQESELRDWAGANGYRVVEVVYDAAYGRSELNRPGLDRILELAREGRVDAVVAWKRDRYGELAIRAIIEYQLRAYDVELLAMDDSSADTDDIMDALTGIERRKIVERTRAGRMAKARQGKVLIGKHVNYGFRANAERDGYEVDEKTAPVLRRIFAEVAAGKPMNAVSDRLNREGVPGPGGGRWFRPTILQLILDEVYKGVWYYNRRTVKRWRDETGRRRTKTTMKPKEEWLAVEVPRIVDDETVEAARAAIRDNVRPSKMGDRVWELTGGIMRCGTCGKAMVARSNRARPGGPQRHYYVCTTYRPQDKEGMCGHRRYHRAEKVEKKAAEMIAEFTGDIDRITAFAMERLEAERQRLFSLDPETETKALSAQLAKLATKLERNKEMYAEGEIEMDELKSRQADLRDQQQALKAELDKIANRKRHMEGLEEDAAIVLGMNAGRLAHMVSAPPEFRRDTYRRLGLKFKLSEDGLLEVDGHLDRNWLPDYDELYNADYDELYNPTYVDNADFDRLYNPAYVKLNNLDDDESYSGVNTTEYILPTAPSTEPKI